MRRCPSSERPALHLAIGRALLAVTPPAELEARLFDIVGHLNQGRALIATRPSGAARRAEPARRNQGPRLDGVRRSRCAASASRSSSRAPTRGATRYAVQYDTHRRLAEALGLTADAAGALP